MPKYVCGECGGVFRSKEARENHTHEEKGGIVPAISRGFRAPDLTLKKVAVLGGVFLMATLFMGTAFFYSSLSPANSGGGSGGSTSEPSPPVGYTVRSQSDVPDVSSGELPASPVSDTQLSQDVQLYLLTRPAVLLQYSCTDCPETVSTLSGIASDYNSEQTWVYVAPYRDMDSRVALTAYQRGPIRLDEADSTRIEDFICTALQQQPVQCAFR